MGKWLSWLAAAGLGHLRRRNGQHTFANVGK